MVMLRGFASVYVFGPARSSSPQRMVGSCEYLASADAKLLIWNIGQTMTNAPNKECDAFRSAAISQIRALHPNLVITTSAGDHKLADGTVPTPAQLQDAWVSTFQKLAQPGTRLAMIGPIPPWRNDDARCLAAHIRDVQACSIAAAELDTIELMKRRRRQQRQRPVWCSYPLRRGYAPTGANQS